MSAINYENTSQTDLNKSKEFINKCINSNKVTLLKKHKIDFNIKKNIILETSKIKKFHSNAIEFQAFNSNQKRLLKKTYYSIGGGFLSGE